MNYRKIYSNLIKKAKKQNRKKTKGIYYESHHIKPKSLFPDLATHKSNLVLLTAREHYLAHWILTKIYPTSSMCYAFLVMCNQAGNQNINRNYKVNSKTYENLKLQFSECNPAKTEQARKKISQTKSGKNHHYYGTPSELCPGYKSDTYTFTHKSGDTITGTRTDIFRNTDLTRAQVSNLISGYRYSAKGWTLLNRPKPEPKTGRNAPAADHTHFHWYNETTGMGIIGSRHDFIAHTHFKPKSVHNILSGSRKSLFGWVVTKL